MKNASASSRRCLVCAMLIFGTIGIFRKYIPLSSGMLAMLRGFIGTAFLLAYAFLRKHPLSWTDIRKNLLSLAVSGILIGLNWILLFESYQYTTVAVATLCYYMAPVMVILVSPLVLKEALTPRKLFCVFLALIGMVFVSGILSGEELPPQTMKGILLGLGAACLYACVILMNKKMKPIDAYGKTIVQLLSAAAVLLPYNLLTSGSGAVPFTASTAVLVAVVGILHTGIAYALYFGSIPALPAQTVALYSYIDPVAAIILSLVVFREDMGLYGFLGAVLILGSTLLSDLPDRKQSIL